MQAEQRQFVFQSGNQADILVSRLASGAFRIEEYPIGAAFVLDETDLPDASGMGWLIETDKGSDGRLRVRQVFEDPNMECINGLPIAPEFAKSLQFQMFSDAIVANGGRWEILFHGIFSAYAPKYQTAESHFSLETHFDEAVKDWFNSRVRADRPAL